MGVLDSAWECLRVLSLGPGLVECRLNRPGKRNALSAKAWEEVRDFFAGVALDGAVRVVVLTGEGSLFCAGVDFAALELGMAPSTEDVAHSALQIRAFGKAWQDSFTNIEKCGKVVIACVHGACIGAGVELISAVDIRFCTEDAVFALKEIDLGLAADVGGLQRFPKIVANQSLVRELVFSGRNFTAQEALPFGLVSRVFHTKADMVSAAVDFAKVVAAKSPVALLGAKTFLNYARDHSVDESLEYAITWNQGMLQAGDVSKSAIAALSKHPAKFPDLPPPKTSTSSKL